MRTCLKKLNEEALSEHHKKQPQKDLANAVTEGKQNDNQRIEKMQQSAKARYHRARTSKKNTKYWFNLHKERPDRQIIYGLFNHNRRLSRKTKTMITIAFKY